MAGPLKSMPRLKTKPTIGDFQKYVVALEKERGFSDQAVLQKCLLLGEEIGELFKAVRKSQKIAVDKNSAITPVSEELADILIYLCSIANRYGIDLEQAFREKEKANHKRTWHVV
jgi:NTP pyrophosphatase (non-canonical NTP hydrolase)